MDKVDDALLQRVADELEIRNVVARLAQVADNVSIDEIDEYVALFTEDATWAVLSDQFLPAQERHGHDELRAAARKRREDGVQGPGTNRRHVISTHSIVFETPDRAQSHCYWQNITETLSEAQVIAGIGQYFDTFVRTPDGWRLHRREIRAG